MKKVLLDTSIIIDFLRRKDKKNSLLFKFAEEDLYSSIITHTELYAGKSVWVSKIAQSELEDLFSGIKIVPLDENISKKAGHIKAHYKNSSLIDCIIASTAIYHTLELITLNVRDFSSIKELKLFID